MLYGGMEKITAWFQGVIADVNLVDIFVPFAILIVGWIAAKLISGALRRVLKRTKIDDKVASLVVGKQRASSVDSGKVISTIVFYVLMLFVFTAFLARLNLAVVAAPIQSFLDAVFAFAPRILSAAGLLIIAWIIARILRRVVTEVFKRTNLDGRLVEHSGEHLKQSPSYAIAEVAYWLVFLLFLPAVLGVLGLHGILEPVQEMMNKMLGYLPNLLSAGVILLFGFFAAKIVQKIVTNILAAAGLDAVSEKYGVSSALGDSKLSGVIGGIVKILIIIPVVVAALQALALEAITRPASNMLQSLLDAVPGVFGAVLVLAISYFVGRFIAGIVTAALHGAGFDKVLVRLGLAKDPPKEGEQSPSSAVGMLVLVAIMLFAAMEAANLLGFGHLAVVTQEVVSLVGRVVFALVIFALGLLLAEVAVKSIKSSSAKHSSLLAAVARVAILAFVGAMALRQMGIADDIIVLAFGLTLGSAAVAAAIAFGMGGREEAAALVRDWRGRIK